MNFFCRTFKIFLTALAVLSLGAPLFAELTFSSPNLNEKNELLFTLSHKISGSAEYSTVFKGKVKDGKAEYFPEALTCFPERLSVFDGASKLLVRNRYGRAIYDFIWGEICDWYIEMAKPRLYGKSGEEARATAQQVLVTVLTGAMKLLHPYMPFITEEIYQALPHDCESIMISPWPKADPALQDKTVEKGMGAVMDAIKSIREMRAQVNANPGKKVPAILLVSDELQAVLTENASYIHQLANVDKLDLLPLDSSKPENAMASVNAGVEVYLPLKGLIDVEAETARLNKELAGLQKEMKRVSGKLQNQGFLAKAPKEVVEKEQAKADEFAAKIKAIEERLAYLKTI